MKNVCIMVHQFRKLEYVIFFKRNYQKVVNNLDKLKWFILYKIMHIDIIQYYRAILYHDMEDYSMPGKQQ